VAVKYRDGWFYIDEKDQATNKPFDKGVVGLQSSFRKPWTCEQKLPGRYLLGNFFRKPLLSNKYQSA
jgi:hypothetical protein